MTLPLSPPIKPQLALTRRALPLGEEWVYEEKLDGFRAIVFVDGRLLHPVARRQKPLPLLPGAELPPGTTCYDGELVIRDAEGRIGFDAMQSRIHPAESRINLLSRDPGELRQSSTCWQRTTSPCWTRPSPTAGAAGGAGKAARRNRAERAERRPQAAKRAARHRGHDGEATRRALRPWETPRDGEGEAGRTIECVVMGWRPGKEEGTVGSLILRPLQRRRAALRRPHLRLQHGGETGRAEAAGAAGNRREAARRSKSLGGRSRPRGPVALPNPNSS